MSDRRGRERGSKCQGLKRPKETFWEDTSPSVALDGFFLGPSGLALMWSLVSQSVHSDSFLPVLVSADDDAQNNAQTYRVIVWESDRPGVYLWFSCVSLSKSTFLGLRVLYYKITLRKPTSYIPYDGPLCLGPFFSLLLVCDWTVSNS